MAHVLAGLLPKIVPHVSCSKRFGFTVQGLWVGELVGQGFMGHLDECEVK